MHVKKVDNGNGAVSLCKHLLPVSGYHIAACYSKTTATALFRVATLPNFHCTAS